VARGCEIAVGEQAFKIALNGTDGAFAVGLFGQNGQKFEKVGGATVFARAGEEADCAGGVV
jgi:hypothetical protein